MVQVLTSSRTPSSTPIEIAPELQHRWWRAPLHRRRLPAAATGACVAVDGGGGVCLSGNQAK